MTHTPVLLKEALYYLNIKEDGLYVDCTLGFAGHSEEILKKIPDGHLYAFDQDTETLPLAKGTLENAGKNFTVFEKNFATIKETLLSAGVEGVDGILYDLGVSSHHFDAADRGFSYRAENAPLDMRMDQRQPLDARTIVNTYSKKDLQTILFQFGEERFAPRIAERIVKEREARPITTTGELVGIVKKALPGKVLSKKGHPAKKTFQAIRIAVNGELEVLKRSLSDALEMLNPEGVIVVITFHSLEDRIVKNIFKDASTVDHPKALPTMPTTTPDFRLLHRKVIRPSEEEITRNNRAHSAKLRAIQKLRKS